MSKNKIHKLFKIVPFGTIVTSRWLKQERYSASDLQQYNRNKWLSSVGYGAYKRHDCEVDKFGIIYGLQQSKTNQFWLGGLSALELLGVAHYIRNQEKSITYLYTNDYYVVFPKWLKNYNQYNWKLVKSNLFSNLLGMESYDAGNFTIIISSRERALLEVANNIPKNSSFDEVNYLVENSSSFRPEVMQLLLQSCNSVKTKRIILFLAEKNKMKWMDEINFSKINLGSGEREIIKNGIFDKKYKITYPQGLFVNDNPQF